MPIDLPEPLTDGVVSIRRWRNHDAADLVQSLQDPEICRWTTIPEPYSDKDADTFMRLAARTESMGVGAELSIRDAVDDALLGGISLKLRSTMDVGEIGYWVAASARGRGLASRAVELIAAWAFADLDLKRLEILTYVGNIASERVAQRCGFVEEGVLRSLREIKGKRADLRLFSLLPGDRS